MSIQVKQDINGGAFPIAVIFHTKPQFLTIKAAIELSMKLDTAISDYQIAEATKGGK